MGQKMGGLLLGIAALYVSALGLMLAFFEHQSRSYKFVTDVTGPPVVICNEQRGVSPEAPRASLYVVR